ncbi:hypothetical protein AVEN_105328-1 [Araneus ventricosus]|uniref:Uncharacterized protein n=1 Tax=Araneus ventricosus TaxID=182803 RepID=A0A4Y2MYH9_ARAVE|nr:hypothetical protein AVEN_105328-1 [Araneus ventricosus]
MKRTSQGIWLSGVLRQGKEEVRSRMTQVRSSFMSAHDLPRTAESYKDTESEGVSVYKEQSGLVEKRGGRGWVQRTWMLLDEQWVCVGTVAGDH